MSSRNTVQPPHHPTESRAPLILLGNILPQSLATLFVLARIATKSLLSRGRTWGADDTLLTLSWLSSLALTVLSCLQTRYGAGRHLASVPLSNLKPSLQLAYGTLLLYNLALGLTKVSISLFYLRVFADRWNKPLSLAALAFVVVYTVPLEIVSIAQCVPPAAVWDRAGHPGAKCIDTVPAFYASAVCNILADVWLIVHAVPRVLELQMGRRQKGLLLFFLSLGWFDWETPPHLEAVLGADERPHRTIIAAIIRAVRISTILRSADKTWVSYDSSIWSAVEVDVGLICASAPATWKLVKKVAPRFAEAMTSGRSSSPSSGRRGGGGGGGRISSSGGTDDALNDAGGPQSSSSDDSTQGHSSKNNDMSGDLP